MVRELGECIKKNVAALPAIEPRASAASCLTIGCSFTFLSILESAAEAALSCNWPKT